MNLGHSIPSFVRVLLTFLVLLLAGAGEARAQYQDTVWTADNGLPQNVIRSIWQAADGYLWIATFDGLARFDGVRFTVFNKANTPGLPTNRIASMLGNPNGDMWLVTESLEVARFRAGKLQTFGTKEGIPSKEVHGITGDAAGNIWILYYSKILKWDEARGTFAEVSAPDPKLQFQSMRWDNSGFWARKDNSGYFFVRGKFVTRNLPAKFAGQQIWSATADKEGQIWVEMADGTRFPLEENSEMPRAAGPQEALTTIYQDDQGNFWTMHIGYRLVRSFEYVSSGVSETIAFVCAFQDSEHNVWLGTEGQGLYRLQRQVVRVFAKEHGLPAENIYPILQDKDGDVWIGAWQTGLSRYRDGKFTNYTEKEKLPGKLVTSIYQDRSGRILVGTHGGVGVIENGHITKLKEPALPDNAPIQAMYQTKDGTMWFGSWTGVLAYKNGVAKSYGLHDGLASDDVRVIIEGKSGELWIGGYGGLTRWQNGKFAHWTETDGLPSNNVRAIYEDADGTLWIGTYDGGLGRFKDGKFTRYNAKVGLYNNGVFQILEDGHGNLWMSSNRGIYRVNKKELNEFADGARKIVTSVAYGKPDGMLNVECNGGLWPAGIRAKDGKLWFPTQQGVAVIDPDRVSTNPLPPQVALESFRLDQTDTPASDMLRIEPSVENLEIRYTAPSFVKSEQVRFKYQLEGLDSDWVEAGSRRTAYYSHVPPGEYTFHVIAANSDGVWNNEGKTAVITFVAPFYKTLWFRFLLAGLVAAIVLLAWYYQVSQLERMNRVQKEFSQQLIASQENERKRIAAELHDSLGQRLVVIKNLALFQIKALKKKAESAENSDTQTIEEISEEASSAIQETRDISYNLRPFQIDRLGLTKSVEGLIRSVANASGIEVAAQIDNIDDALAEDVRINFYRIVQESLSNILKHAKATKVDIRVKRDEHTMSLKIQDNGKGFATGMRISRPKNSGFGLKGMSERAALLGGDFRIESTPGTGTTMTVNIPLRNTA